MQIYCGTDDLKKNQKRGTMAECAEKKQIRFYGLNKVDKLLVDSHKSKKVVNPRDDIMLKYVAIDGKINKINRQINGLRGSDKNSDKKNILLDSIKKLTLDKSKLFNQLKDLDKKTNSDKKNSDEKKVVKKKVVKKKVIDKKDSDEKKSDEKKVVKKVIKKDIKKVKGAGILSASTDYNNVSRKTLEEFGNYPIKEFRIARTPIMKFINTTLNFLSNNSWSNALKKYGIDKLFHLSIIVTLQLPPGAPWYGSTKFVKIEKNEVVNITTNFSFDKKTEYLEVPLNGQTYTLNQILNDTLNKVGKNKFFLYDGLNNNCQSFISYILQSMKKYNLQTKDFLYQNLEGVKDEIPPFIGKLMNAVTHSAAVANKLLGGDLDDTQKARLLYEKERKEANKSNALVKNRTLVDIANKKEAEKVNAQQMNPDNDDFYNKLNERKAENKKQKILNPNYHTNKDFLKLSDADKARYFRNLHKSQSKFSKDTDDRLLAEQKAYEEAERLKEEENDPWNILTKGLTKAVSYIPGVGSIVSKSGEAVHKLLKGHGMLKSKIKGKGKVNNNFKLHAIVLEKADFDKDKAINMGKDILHIKKTPYIRETDTQFRIRAIPKTKFINKSFKTKNLQNGFNLIFGVLKN